jgi:hypothetical protein
MKFRNVTTYNSHDTAVTVGERITIHHDTPRRCELSLRRVIKAGEAGIGLEALTAQINKDRNCLYSESDIRYVMRRLCREGLAIQIGRDHFRASTSALQAWRELEKEWI